MRTQRKITAFNRIRGRTFVTFVKWGQVTMGSMIDESTWKAEGRDPATMPAPRFHYHLFVAYRPDRQGD